MEENNKENLEGTLIEEIFIKKDGKLVPRIYTLEKDKIVFIARLYSKTKEGDKISYKKEDEGIIIPEFAFEYNRAEKELKESLEKINGGN